MKLYADLHIHSCLSPCGDELMTPNNIVNMALLKGLDIIAVSDHNTCGNLSAVCSVAAQNGLTVIPAMEMETMEEVHTLAYFATLEDALSFSDEIYTYLPSVANNPDFFGRQLYMNDDDEIVAQEPKLLLSALSITLEEGFEIVKKHNGIAVPAHIDRPSHGMIPILGFINPHLGVTCVEVSPIGIAQGFAQYDPRLLTITNSDAHDLGSILEPIHQIELEQNTPEAFLEMLRRGKA